MTIYFAGSEDIDFTLAGSVASSISGGAFDANWSRACVAVTGVSSAWPMTSYATTPSFGSRSSFWVHAAFVAGGGNGTTSGNIVMALADAGGVGRILVRGTGTAGQLKISSRNAAGTIVDFAGATTASGAFLTSTLCKFDLFVNYAVSGRVQLYINGVSAADTGAGVNVTTDSATSLSFFYMGLNGAGATADWSQVIVADTDTRSMNLWLMNSNSTGTAAQWTGTATSVNKATISDGAFISSTTANQVEDYKPSGGGGSGGIAQPVGSFAVPAVVLSFRALNAATGPQHVEAGFNFNGTRQWSADQTPGTSFGNIPNLVWITNPNTGAAWTISDITASTFAYSVQSTT